MGTGEVGERVTGKLLDAERDAFAFGIDRENDSLDFITLLVVVNSLFAGFLPGEVGEVNEAINAAVKTDEHAEVGDRLDLTLDVIALSCGSERTLPTDWPCTASCRADTATVFVDLEDHDFDFFAERHNLARINCSCSSSPFRTRERGLRCRLRISTNRTVRR